ncbi:hypothetical protein CCAND95_620007 [Capnocytophaga canis]|uniref:Uncharacterized protein n=1 Tax=Capnocytophaga canis TaxID=1848903 RepID=A0A0B7IA31_9FLAO|nr:hypothetical protein [Capnocytophaga canis]CEN45929.1 hypothetical protein CCAND95_620007 [Capnocytophaga canis]CEN48595.1 hypothetical protein CCAND38_610007 [Capnocytophaga canis]
MKPNEVAWCSQLWTFVGKKKNKKGDLRMFSSNKGSDCVGFRYIA